LPRAALGRRDRIAARRPRGGRSLGLPPRLAGHHERQRRGDPVLPAPRLGLGGVPSRRGGCAPHAQAGDPGDRRTGFRSATSSSSPSTRADARVLARRQALPPAAGTEAIGTAKRSRVPGEQHGNQRSYELATAQGGAAGFAMRLVEQRAGRPGRSRAHVPRLLEAKRRLHEELDVECRANAAYETYRARSDDGRPVFRRPRANCASAEAPRRTALRDGHHRTRSTADTDV
jgi:hypothetical protein